MDTATTAEATVSERLLFLIEKQLSKNDIFNGQRCLSGGDIAKLVDADPDPLKCYRYNHPDLFQEDVDFVKGEFGYVFYTRSGFMKFKPYVRSKYNRRSSYNNYNSGYNSRHETVDIVFDTILEKYFDVPVSVATTVTDAVVKDTDTTNKESEEMGSAENTAVAVNEAITFTTFENSEFGNLRVAMIDSEPWFIGKDIAVSLGYAKPENAVASHVDNEDKTTTLIQGTGSNYKSNAVIINESGMYSLILSSKLHSAKKFKRWVTAEVLPSLRKNGVYVSNTAKAAESVGANLSNLSNEDAMLYILLKEEAQNKIIGDLIQSQQNWMAVQQKHNEEFRKEIMSYFKEFGDGIAKTVSDFMTQQMNNSQNLNTTISNALECVQKNSNSHTSSIENMCESLKSIVSGIGQITAATTSSSASSESAATNNEETKKEETVKADYDPAWRNRTLAWANMYAAKHGISNANIVLGNMYSAIDNKYNVNIRKLRSEYVRKRMLTKLSVIDFIATFRKTRDIFDEIVKGIMEGEEKEEQVHQNNDVVQNQAMNSQNAVTSTETESIYKAQEKKMQNYNARYKKFCQLKDDGVSMTEIAKLLGLSYSTLFAYTYNGRYYKEHKLAG